MLETDELRGASLGTIAKSSATQESPGLKQADGVEASARRILRFALQAEARSLIGRERVSVCLRRRIPGRSAVDVLYSPAHARAHYAGLQICGSVWHCPVCASKITERRRLELESAIVAARAAGLSAYLQTFTVRHSRRDQLRPLLESFMGAVYASKSTRRYRELRQRTGCVGSIRALEVTAGRSGWHPHCHELVFLPKEVPAEVWEREMRPAWSWAAECAGLDMNEHGYDMRETFGAVEAYVAKFGHEPAEALPWGVSSELSKLHVKRGRGGNETPFSLLYWSLMGHGEASARFLEYARAFKGRRQLTWSPGLRALLLGDEVERSDEDLAGSGDEDAILLGQLTPGQWRAVLASDCRGELLELASSGDWGQVLELLESIGAGS